MGCCNFDSRGERLVKSIKTIDFYVKKNSPCRDISFCFKRRLFRGVELSVDSYNLGEFFGSVKEVSFSHSYPVRSTEHYSCNNSITFRCGSKDIGLTEIMDGGVISLRVTIFEGTNEISREVYEITAPNILRSLVEDLKCLGVKIKENVDTTFLCTNDTGYGYMRVSGKNLV